MWCDVVMDLSLSSLFLASAIYIGSLVGDQQSVAQSSLAVVMLQQYTSSLGEWEEMLHQAQFDNSKLLQDYAVSKYTQGMKLTLPTPMKSQSTSSGQEASVALSASERKFIQELQLESGGESSLHFTCSPSQRRRCSSASIVQSWP
jgi:hypothetical protein